MVHNTENFSTLPFENENMIKAVSCLENLSGGTPLHFM